MRPLIKFTKKNKKNIYSLLLVDNIKKSNRVIEVLGSYNPINKNLNLNIFRLIFWLSKNTEISGNVFNLFLKFNIFNFKKNCKII